LRVVALIFRHVSILSLAGVPRAHAPLYPGQK